jgi:oxygen-independent coproporphyrinogen III oxidase
MNKFKNRLPGIYIHIPFCRQACHYCNFHFSTSLGQRQAMVDALVQEIAFTVPFAAPEAVGTVYFGGGTPSLLTEAELGRILGAVHSKFTLLPGAEISLEANPDDMTAHSLATWKGLGINRLSIGIQSFLPEELRWMNRAHNDAQAKDCIALAQAAGFNNLSVDLIYGSPLLSDADWQGNVQRVVEMGVPHLSCYALTVEPQTALHYRINKRQSPPVDGDKQAAQFLLLMDWLAAAGYEHYEISNFALPGKRSRHNSSYWQGVPYYGFGPSAHSYDGRARRWNLANNAQYIQSVGQGVVPFEEELLSPSQQLNEYIMIALRTMEGIDLDTVEKRFGAGQRQRLLQASAKYCTAGNALLDGGRLALTRSGKLLADGIAADLFV